MKQFADITFSIEKVDTLTTISRIILTCPSCGRDGEQFSLSSSNTFGWRQWSDGWGEGLYGPIELSLRHCSFCETIFPQEIAKWRSRDSEEFSPRFLGQQDLEERTIPPAAPSPSHGKQTLFERMERLSSDGGSSHWLQRSTFGAQFRCLRNSYPIEADQEVSARSAVLSARWIDTETERMLRLQWWWDWNSLDRPTAPTMHHAVVSQSANGSSIPAEMSGNLERLIELIVRPEDVMLIGEIRRRQGDFDEALRLYTADRKVHVSWRQALITLAVQHQTGLVELVE